MRKTDYILKLIERAITTVEADPLTPANRSPEVSGYLDRFSLLDENDISSLNDLVLSLSYDAIGDQLREEILPENIRERILLLRNEYLEAVTQKENEVANRDFEAAVRKRDQERLLAGTIKELTSELILEVTPNHIRDTLHALGWQQGEPNA